MQAGKEAEAPGKVTAEDQVVMSLDHTGVSTIGDLHLDIGVQPAAGGMGWERSTWPVYTSSFGDFPG